MRRSRDGIYLRQDGRWQGRLFFRGKRISIYAKTRQDAETKLAQKRVDKGHGLLVEPSKQTVATYLTWWLETRRANRALRESTAALCEMVIRRHIVPRIGTVMLQRLTPANVEDLLAGLQRKGVGAPVRRVVLQGVLHPALKKAVALRLIQQNPAADVTRPKVPRKEMQTLTTDQAKRFLEAATQDRYHALFCVLLGCGLRLGEALGLTWPDLDLTRGYLTVRRQLCEVAGDKHTGRKMKLWLDVPKTKASMRRVDLPAFVVEALRQHQERMAAEEHLLTDHLLVFVDTDGGYIRRSNLRRRSFLPLLRTAGIPRIRLHDLRHSAATLMLLDDVPSRVVQERLGHANIAVTLGVYSHVLPSMQKEAAQKMDALLRPQP